MMGQGLLSEALSQVQSFVAPLVAVAGVEWRIIKTQIVGLESESAAGICWSAFLLNWPSNVGKRQVC